jgi:hypothetical protein
VACIYKSQFAEKWLFSALDLLPPSTHFTGVDSPDILGLDIVEGDATHIRSYVEGERGHFVAAQHSARRATASVRILGSAKNGTRMWSFARPGRALSNGPAITATPCRMAR